MTIEPSRLTNFNRTEHEWELLLIFSVAVAGKNAKTTAKAIDRLFDGLNVPIASPKQIVARWFAIGGYPLVIRKLQLARTGNYQRLGLFLNELVERHGDLRTISISELSAFHGISHKTAHMIILHSRPDQQLAVIDTHVLKFLRDKLRLKKLPKSSPSSHVRYVELQSKLISWIDFRARYEPHICVPRQDGGCIGCINIKHRPDGRPDYAAFDLDLWNVYAGNA